MRRRADGDGGHGGGVLRRCEGWAGDLEIGKVGGSGIKPIFSSPTLTADGKRLLIGEGLHDDSDSRLLCINAETGKLEWQIQTPLHVESSPAVHGDLVVVGAGSIEGSDRKPKGHPGMVIAARISDGTKLWEHQVNDPESSPAISADGQAVYIGSGFQGNAVGGAAHGER